MGRGAVPTATAATLAGIKMAVAAPYPALLYVLWVGSCETRVLLMGWGVGGRVTWLIGGGHSTVKGA